MTVGAEPELLRDSLRAQRLNWISIAGLEGEMRVQVKIRHRHEPAWATLRKSGEDEVEVAFRRTGACRNAGAGGCVL